MSPITRETLIARITKLEADATISINEGFYLRTMRALLAEWDKHPNGMMQLSNELADWKRRYAELEAVLNQRNAECDRLINEKLAYEQMDTAPDQFESLAGERVSEPYMLPTEMTPEMMRAVQLNSELGSYATANLAGAYDLFSEFWKVACLAAGNSPVIPDSSRLAYEIKGFGTFKAVHTGNELNTEIIGFAFDTRCVCIDGEDKGFIPKYALQSVINTLQDYCDSLDSSPLECAFGGKL